jgi:hypothetical protein
MNDKPNDEQLQKFEGSLMYRSESCKGTIQDLKDSYNQLQQAFREGSTISGEDLNRIGRMHRYVKYAVILDVAGLFDRTKGTLSLPRLAIYLQRIKHPSVKKFNFTLSDIQRRYKKQLDVLELNRHTVAAHAGEKQLDSLLLTTDEILSMPIHNLLKEIQNLVMETLYFDKIIAEAGTMYMDVKV